MSKWMEEFFTIWTAKVFSLVTSAAMMLIGFLLAGSNPDRIGGQVWLLVGGVVTVLMSICSFFGPAIMRVEAGNPADQKVDSEGVAIALEPGD